MLWNINFIFPFWISSSQLTNSYFSEGWLNHQPDKKIGVSPNHPFFSKIVHYKPSIWKNQKILEEAEKAKHLVAWPKFRRGIAVSRRLSIERNNAELWLGTWEIRKAHWNILCIYIYIYWCTDLFYMRIGYIYNHIYIYIYHWILNSNVAISTEQSEVFPSGYVVSSIPQQECKMVLSENGLSRSYDQFESEDHNSQKSTSGVGATFFSWTTHIKQTTRPEGFGDSGGKPWLVHTSIMHCRIHHWRLFVGVFVGSGRNLPSNFKPSLLCKDPTWVKIGFPAPTVWTVDSPLNQSI